MVPASGATTEKGAFTPFIPSASSPFDPSSEMAPVQHAPPSKDHPTSETSKEIDSMPTPSTQTSAVTKAATGPKDVGASIPDSASITSPVAETPKAEAKPVEPPGPEPSTADTTQSETTDFTRTHAAMGTQMATPAPDASRDFKQTESQPKPAEHTTTATAGPVQAPEATPSPKVVDKVNGHSPATIPTKKPEATDPNKPHTFPSTDSKSPSTTSSPATASKFGSARKKRVSIFGKMKNLFTHDKEAKTEKK